MQITPVAPVAYFQPPNPERARMQLETVQFDMSKLDRQLRTDIASSAPIAGPFPAQVAALATGLRNAGSALRPLGSREAILGAALIEASGDVTRFAAELQQAQAAGQHIDADAAWLHRFERPTELVTVAFDVLDSSSTWG
ncbi:MAG: hypothetical protein JWN72_912 [Thermoleophilia bacterium]|nr:hypothetical protein [Thermoleophilia bacterium]